MIWDLFVLFGNRSIIVRIFYYFLFSHRNDVATLCVAKRAAAARAHFTTLPIFAVRRESYAPACVTHLYELQNSEAGGNLAYTFFQLSTVM